MTEHIVSESLTEMKYSEHLKELRKRLIYSIGIVLAIFYYYFRLLRRTTIFLLIL